MRTRTRKHQCHDQRHAAEPAGTLAAAGPVNGKGGSPVGPWADYPNGTPNADCDGGGAGGYSGLRVATSPTSARPLSFADGREGS